MKRCVRLPSVSSSFLVLAFVTAVAALAARPAHGGVCTIANFNVLDGLGPDGTYVAGQKVTVQVGFEIGGFAITPPPRGSVRIDYGDGTAGDSDPQFLTYTAISGNHEIPAIRVDHIYTNPGSFRVFVKGGSVENERCTGANGLGSTFLTVVGNPPRSRAKNPAPTPTVPTFTRAKSAAVIPPVGSYEKVGKEKGTPVFAFAPGQIARASVSLSALGNVLKVEGTGKCGLKVFEELDGRALRTYDFKGPLPTSIRMLNTLPGIHVAKIEGDKSSESCGGTASASFPIAKKKGVL